MHPSRRPAVFLDRDGTLIEDRGHLQRPEQAVFFEDTFSALRALQERFSLFIVTNQSGIGDGLVTADQAASVNAHVVAELARHGVCVTDVYVCPHSKRDGCSCRKPNPNFLWHAAGQYGIDLSTSFTVGDHPSDVELARRAGARSGVLLLTGHGYQHRSDVPPSTPMAATLSEAVATIGRLADQEDDR